MTRRQRPPRGAALLVAMVLLSVVATLAAGMVWQQWRAVQVETAERSRSQSGWMLLGAQDWARLILREDARSGKATSLNEPWATPLAEARLSSFLAADRDNNADSGPEAFLAGSITDAQARYNLRNLLLDGKVDPLQLAALQRLCTSAGLGPDTASALADGLLDAAILARLEATWSGRTPEQRSAAWIERQMSRVETSLKAMSQGLGEKPWCHGNAFTLADIAVGCALGYLDFRFGHIDWRGQYPNLNKLNEKLAVRPSFIDSAPPAP